MTRTTAAAIALGSALGLSALTACSSHSGSSASSTTASATASTTTSATASSAATSPSAAGSASASGGASAAPSGSAPAGSVTASTPASSIPATVTSPGTKPTTSVTPTATTSATTAAGSSTRCRNAQLKVSLGAEGAAAGNRYTPLIFTNTSSTSCTLSGHPGVSYVAGDKGVQVGSSAKRDPGTIATITLAPGGSASAQIHEANYQNFDQSVCKPVTTRGFRVYPPGSTAAFFVPRPARECSGTNLPATALSIGVVKAGTNPSA